MLNQADISELGIPYLVFDVGTPASEGCEQCAAHRPAPQPDGNLQVDPEIHLPSPGIDVDIAYYYNAVSTNNGPFGYGRQLSLNLTAQASGSPAIVTLTRANGALISYCDTCGATATRSFRTAAAARSRSGTPRTGPPWIPSESASNSANTCAPSHSRD